MNKTLKRTLVGLLAVLCVALCAFGISLMPQNSTYAATTDSNLQMNKGAELYLNENSGLRFSYTVANYNEENNYGMLIAPKDYLDKADVTVGDATVDYVGVLTAFATSNGLAEPIVANNLKAKTGSVINFSIVNLQENNYAREFFGVGFIKTGDTYTYAVQNDNVRSVFEVANIAMNEYTYGEMDEETEAVIDSKKDLVDSYITTGFDFVYSDVKIGTSYAGADAFNDITLIKQDGKEKVDLSSQLHWNYSSSNQTVATIANDGTITPLAYGNTDVTLSLGGVKNITKTITIVKDEVSAMLAKTATEGAVFNADGSITLPAYNYANGYTWTLAAANPDYVAFKGDYGAGNAIDIEFTGNNMPIVKVLSALNGKLSNSKSADNSTEIDESIGQGAILFNGTGRATSGDFLGTDSNYGFYIVDGLMRPNQAMGSNDSARGYTNYGGDFLQFRQDNLTTNSTKEYKYTIAIVDKHGTKCLFVTFYEKVSGNWSQIGDTIECDLVKTTYTDTNIVIEAGLTNKDPNTTTFKVSAPYAYSYDPDAVTIRTVGNVSAPTEDNGVYSFSIARQTVGTYPVVVADRIIFDAKYGVGTYVDITSTGGMIPNVQMFAPLTSDNLQFNDSNGSLNESNSLIYLGQSWKASDYYPSIYSFGKNHKDNGNFMWRAVWSSNTVSGTTNDIFMNPSGAFTGATGSYRFTMGTYVGDNGNVWIEVTLRNGVAKDGNIVSTTKCDTSISLTNWYAAGAITISNPFTDGSADVGNYTLEIYYPET